MIMPAATRITKAKQLEPSYPTVEGPVIQRPAVVNQCDKMCVTGKPYYLYIMGTSRIFDPQRFTLLLDVTAM